MVDSGVPKEWAAAAAVNLIGCQLFTLSRVDGIIETLGIQSLVTAQAPNSVRAAVSVPDDLFTTGSMESNSSGMPNWRREAQMAQERLNQRPAVEEREMQQQNPVVAEGGGMCRTWGVPPFRPLLPKLLRHPSIDRWFGR